MLGALCYNQIKASREFNGHLVSKMTHIAHMDIDEGHLNIFCIAG